MDNDVYGHVNNVVYYAYFDTIANRFLIEKGGLDIHAGPVIGLVVNSQCRYREAVAFPDQLDGGFRVNRVGSSSVEYGLGIFKAGQDRACASGTFTHVFVERETRKPAPITGRLREALLAACHN
ncbi:acyl-CoA thioesterase [Exilibacterium tricleocarpae]|uniref:Acyl-CoA thioesterase n=2 Tax=Exilibacterium tricleocarpae TaxID=2591008 RepID=A0A545TM60_9GAMM|nr:acyl-CoA thioesterase [Exilibacterium tricleocarpae]